MSSQPINSNDKIGAKRPTTPLAGHDTTQLKQEERFDFLLPSAQLDARPLTRSNILYLQRTFGNQYVQRLVSQVQKNSLLTGDISKVNSSKTIVQRDHKDNAEDFIPWMTNHEIYKQYREAGDCAPSTKAIAELLSGEGITYQIRGILMFHRPEGRASNMNYNHYVVVATVAGQRIVIDPTQGQFQGGGPMVATEAQWTVRFQSLQALVVRSQEGNERIWKNTPMKYKDCENWDDANNYGKQWKLTFDEADGTVLNPNV